jgi:hypothetical protein
MYDDLGLAFVRLSSSLLSRLALEARQPIYATYNRRIIFICHILVVQK